MIWIFNESSAELSWVKDFPFKILTAISRFIYTGEVFEAQYQKRRKAYKNYTSNLNCLTNLKKLMKIDRSRFDFCTFDLSKRQE